MARLSIFWGDRLVGYLSRHTKGLGRLRFRYDRDWLSDIGRPISLILPCREERFPQEASTAFFENLLPESDVRTILAFNNRFDKKDTYAFLEHFGQDCAGALSIIPEGQELDTKPWQYTEITDDLVNALDAIQKSIKKGSSDVKLYSEIQPARLSIAGAQDKLPVYYSDGKFFLPANSGSATTHIIKPISPLFNGIQRNEAFCMELARRIGLRVPRSELYHIGSHELYLIERFDRVITEERVARVHQEDFCQAMGVRAYKKYQVDGGPDFAKCRSLIDEHLSHQSVDVRTEWVKVLTFNHIIGNHDAHGKNFSIIHGPEIKMAPYYDLLSTMVYDGLEEVFAMSIGKASKHENIKARSYKDFARDMGFRPSKVAEILNSIIEKVHEEASVLFSEHEGKYGSSPIYSDLEKVLSVNLQRVAEIRDKISDKGTGRK